MCFLHSYLWGQQGRLPWRSYCREAMHPGMVANKGGVFQGKPGDQHMDAIRMATIERFLRREEEYVLGLQRGRDVLVIAFSFPPDDCWIYRREHVSAMQEGMRHHLRDFSQFVHKKVSRCPTSLPPCCSFSVLSYSPLYCSEYLSFHPSVSTSLSPLSLHLFFSFRKVCPFLGLSFSFLTSRLPFQAPLFC